MFFITMLIIRINFASLAQCLLQLPCDVGLKGPLGAPLLCAEMLVKVEHIWTMCSSDIESPLVMRCFNIDIAVSFFFFLLYLIYVNLISGFFQLLISCSCKKTGVSTKDVERNNTRDRKVN